MTKKSPIALAALLLAVGTASLSLMPNKAFAQASASAAASVPQNTVRKEMGKPFAEEIAQFEETHAWACDQSVDAFSDAITRLFNKPLVAVGSGNH